MRNHIVFWLILFGLIFTIGCARGPSETTAVRVNEFVMSADEFQEQFDNSDYPANKQGKEKFLKDLISRKLLLQEAEQMGLDKQPEFLKEVERFWEKTLLKNIIYRKSKELAGEVSVYEDEIRAQYEKMVDKGAAEGSYEEMYDRIKWQLLRQKQEAAFNEWLKGLRENSEVEVNKQLLGLD